jgi:hypothetical protein
MGRGSPELALDGGRLGRMKMIGGGTDSWSPAVEIKARKCNRPVWFSSKRWFGRRCTRGGGRRWPAHGGRGGGE